MNEHQNIQIARVYLRVSTDEQDLQRQESIVTGAKRAGYYVAAVYREKASGARPDRPELLRLISDLQPGEVVIAESIDRVSRLPLEEAEKLVAAIKERGARLAIPGVVDLSELAETTRGVSRIVIEAVQEMLLRVALQIARDDYEERRERQRQGIEIARAEGKYRGRQADTKKHRTVIALRQNGHSIAETARLSGLSVSQVKRVWSNNKQKDA
jgi:DNA invertase Pin-like site-specific DNA recombinase